MTQIIIESAKTHFSYVSLLLSIYQLTWLFGCDLDLVVEPKSYDCLNCLRRTYTIIIIVIYGFGKKSVNRLLDYKSEIVTTLQQVYLRKDKDLNTFYKAIKEQENGSKIAVMRLYSWRLSLEFALHFLRDRADRSHNNCPLKASLAIYGR